MAQATNESVSSPAKTASTTIASTGTETENWQRKKMYVAERNATLVANELWSDITFYIEQDDIRIPAHRVILAAGSSVFEKIAFGTMCETGEVQISDIGADAFKEVIRYLYTDQSILTKDNVFECMYAAHKYDLPFLENMCAEFIIPMLREENVCSIYECTFLYDNELRTKCAEIIRNETREVLKSDEFYGLDIKLVKEMMAFEQLNAEEGELFTAILKWANLSCVTNDLPTTIENKRAQLKGCETFIRFPTMTEEEFKKCLNMAPRFFTDKEIEDITQAITSPVSVIVAAATSVESETQLQLPYPTADRKHSVVYFCKVCSFLTGPIMLRDLLSCYENFSIRCSVNVRLYGFGVFATDQEGPSRLTIIQNRFAMDIKLTKDVFQCDGTDKIYKVMFEEPIEIIANRWTSFQYINIEGLNHSVFYHCKFSDGHLRIAEDDGDGEIIFEMVKDKFFDHCRIPTLYYIRK